MLAKGKKWRPLQPGDVVDVVAPGYPPPREAIAQAQAFLLKWKLIPRIPKDILGKHFLHAQTHDVRLRHLKAALVAKDSAAVWCLRGGYGSNLLLPDLQKLRMPSTPKLLVGISDITSLHVFLTQKWGWSTLHGPLLDRLSRGGISGPLEKELRKTVFGEKEEIIFDRLKPLNSQARRMKKTKGSVVGGNLTVLQSTLGTPWQLETKGKFLFIEDLGERGYRVDRMLEQFRQAGLLDSCKALLIGHFLGDSEPKGKKATTPKVFARWAKDLDLPIFSGVPAGHGEVQRPLPFFTSSTLVGGSYGTLVMESGGKI